MVVASLDARLGQMRENGTLGYWGERIYHQIAYAARLSRLREGRYDDLLHAAIDFLQRAQALDGAITRSAAQGAEEKIRSLSGEAKRFTMICAAHAHIDMNWMWRWDETVGVTLDTFRTMLDLLREYPAFTFSQSQASTYRIVEEYAPQMLPEIRARVQEGRWEVTASTWVEPDKNMPNGESLSRHILYTKRYLSDLLGLDPASLNIDFEPDTFGHSQNVPEILAGGGVKYYYHCRGYDGHHLYRWKAPSGASVLVYREPIWYNAVIEPEMALYVPEFCAQHQTDTMLKVYGVGDHGGGPTRRDIERIMDMSAWPVFPTIRFGTFHEYFAEVEKVAGRLPEVNGELNFVFTGCYTTQTRIKKANRVSEAVLHEAELFDAAAALGAGGEAHGRTFEAAWRNVLFNQFHDILPGSGVVDTREHAMGLFQQTFATANMAKAAAMRQIAGAIDTSAWLSGTVGAAGGVDTEGAGPAEVAAGVQEAVGAEVSVTAKGAADANEAMSPAKAATAKGAADAKGTTSEGAGVGYGIQAFKIPQTDRGRGKTRLFHLFNAVPVARREAVELVVWDWPGDVRRMQVQDAQGRIAAHQVLEQGTHPYWGHQYMRVLIQASVPSCGYSTYVLTESQESDLPLPLPRNLRVERAHAFILENEWLRVEFDARTGALASMVDKGTGEELVSAGGAGGVFRLIREDESQGMTAWKVGRYMDVQDLVDNVRIRSVSAGPGAIRQAIVVEIAFSRSTLKATVSLDEGSPLLRYDVECDWREIGERGAGIPQLGFYVPLAYDCPRLVYDVPFGVVERPAMDLDVPANRFAVAVNPDAAGRSLLLATDSKHGFRGRNDSLAVTLIRSSFDPDPYPEIGKHAFSLFLGPVTGGNSRDLILRGAVANHPLSVVSAAPSAGVLPLEQSFLRIEEGSVALSAVKTLETDAADVTDVADVAAHAAAHRWIVRLYETDGRPTRAVLRFFKNVAKAYFVDLNEEAAAGAAQGAGAAAQAKAQTNAQGAPQVTAEGEDIQRDDNGTLSFSVAPFRVVSVCVEFA